MDPQSTKTSVRQAFEYCERMAKRHYENFPVASLFLPPEKRPHVAAIYAFARTADDFADEGNLQPFERLAKLDEWEQKLQGCYNGKAEHPVFVALSETIRQHGIPPGPLSALLEAFRMDVTKRRYADYGELLYYCARSANPVGQLVLYIFGAAGERTIPLSDNICTALQLANFWQDVSVDRSRGRIYVPLEDFDRLGYTEPEYGRGVADRRFADLMKYQIDRTRELFRAGEPLIQATGPDLELELTLTIRGGMAILDRVERAGAEVISRRPRLSLADKAALLGGALLKTKVRWPNNLRTRLWKPRPQT
jgi:squalene synthase HpnC